MLAVLAVLALAVGHLCLGGDVFVLKHACVLAVLAATVLALVVVEMRRCKRKSVPA